MIAAWLRDALAAGVERGRACAGRFGLQGFVEVGDGDRTRRAEWTLGTVDAAEPEGER